MRLTVDTKETLENSNFFELANIQVMTEHRIKHYTREQAIKRFFDIALKIGFKFDLIKRNAKVSQNREMSKC